MRYLAIILLLNIFISKAQKTDSLTKCVDLNQVIIDSDKEKVEGFNFYRSNKLSTTEDILSRMQGVNLVKRGAFGLEPMLRVYSANQINTTIDGMKIYGACTDKMDPISIYVEPSNLHALSINHGASGSAMGSTIGGSLNMQLKQPDFSCHNKILAQLSKQFTSVNKGFATNFSVNTATKKLAVRFSGVIREANNYNSANGEVKNSAFKKYSMSTGLAYLLNTKNTLRLDFIYDAGRDIGFPALTMDVGKASAQIFSLTHFYKKENGLLKSAETKVYYNNIFHSMDDTKRTNIPMHMDMPSWSKTFGFWHELKFGTNQTNLTYRIDAHRANTRADMTMYPLNESEMYMQTLPTNYLNNIGNSVQYMFKIDSNSLLRFTGRLDYYNQFALPGIGALQWDVLHQNVVANKDNLLKNISLNYRYVFKRNFMVEPTLSYGERLPSSNERYGFYLYNRLDGFDYLGSPNLKPEAALQAEVNFKLLLPKSDWYVNVFYHHVKDFIFQFLLPNYSAMTIGARGVKSFQNLNFAVVKGIEFGGKWNLNQSSQYLVNSKFAYATTFNNEPLPQVSPIKIQQALRLKRKFLQVQVEYDLAFAQNRINLQSGEVTTPFYQLVNVRTSKNIMVKKLIFQLGIACENVLNATYREHLDWGGILRPGRNFSLNLGVIFN